MQTSARYRTKILCFHKKIIFRAACQLQNQRRSKRDIPQVTSNGSLLSTSSLLVSGRLGKNSKSPAFNGGFQRQPQMCHGGERTLISDVSDNIFTRNRNGLVHILVL